ncbi:MAG TPA: transglycosylase domain-containing protein, partial [Syntrophobacteraceae bacterium]|nr:transglycosylase domain-containing protein [Syntrophobacteraceae bacterium]
RKIREAVLAYRIDHSLTKDEILYLYLNQIYFGAGAYGVEAAARTYFDRHVGELSLAQAAMLAGLPKAPSRFSPIQHYSVARERQEYVLKRMAEVGFITSDQAKMALAEQLRFAKPRQWTLKSLNSFTEEVRRQLEARYGRDGLYKEGMSIHTTMDVRAQEIAKKALDIGLRELDKRHSRYRGVNLNVPQDDWPGALKVLAERNGTLTQGQVVAALVTAYDPRFRMAMDADFRQTGCKDIPHRRSDPCSPRQASGGQELADDPGTGPRDGRGAHGNGPRNRKGPLHGWGQGL